MNLLKRIYRLLLPAERKTCKRVAAAVFLTALLDFVGLAALLPVLYYLLDNGESKQMALWFCLGAVTVVMIKNVAVVGFSRYQNLFLMSLYKRLSYSLFASYYKRGLLFIREQGTNRLAYEINYMCFAFSQSMLTPMLRMAGDGMLVLLVTVALLIYDGATVMVLYVSFLPFVILYIWGVRKKVRKYGEEELKARREQAKVVMDTFRGYTELKVSGAFLTRRLSFLESIDKVKDTRIKLDTVYRLPMFFSELSIILGLTLLVVLGSGDVKVLIGIFAVAAFRLLPAIRAILSGWTQIQNVSGYLKTIEDGIVDADNKETSITEDIAFEHELKVSGLCYAYPNGKKVLDNFQLTIKKGEYIGFRGYSGAGKSTLFNLLLGLLKPTEGEIRIDGKLLTPDVQSAWLHHVGYVPQEVFLFQGTLAENIALGCKEINRSRVKEVMQLVSMDAWLNTLPNGVDTDLNEAGGNLSGGQKQRIGIARALYKDIDVLLLDEATSALDNETEREVNETLAKLNKKYKKLTILSIAHRESSLSYCDRIITLENDYE